jgi:hypothetical protein
LGFWRVLYNLDYLCAQDFWDYTIGFDQESAESQPSLRGFSPAQNGRQRYDGGVWFIEFFFIVLTNTFDMTSELSTMKESVVVLLHASAWRMRLLPLGMRSL